MDIRPIRDFPQDKTQDCTRCQVCKASNEETELFLTPERFRWQYAFCLEHYEEKLGHSPEGYRVPIEYEPYDLDA